MLALASMELHSCHAVIVGHVIWVVSLLQTVVFTASQVRQVLPSSSLCNVPSRGVSGSMCVHLDHVYSSDWLTGALDCGLQVSWFHQ